MPTTSESGLSYVIYVATGGETSLTIPFGYLDKSHVLVDFDGVGKLYTTDFTIAGSYSSPGNGTLNFVSGHEPTAGALVRIYRKTPIERLYREFPDGSVLVGSDLNNAHLQLLYRLQEGVDLQTVVPPGSSVADPFITITISDDADVDYDIPGAFDKAQLDIYQNGILVHPSDYTLTVAGNTTTITFLQTIFVGDIFLVRILVNGGSLTVGSGSVTEGSIADGSVSNAKLADGAVSWDKLADGSFTDWDGITDLTGPQDLLNDLNDRLEALEALTISQVQIERVLSPAIPSAEATYTASFSFTPDYVLINHSKGSSPTDTSTGAQAGPTFMAISGQTATNYRHNYSTDPGTHKLFLNQVTLSGATLSYKMYGEGDIDGGYLNFIAIKE